jgi:hypothetical protein
MPRKRLALRGAGELLDVEELVPTRPLKLSTERFSRGEPGSDGADPDERATARLGSFPRNGDLATRCVPLAITIAEAPLRVAKVLISTNIFEVRNVEY